MSILIIKIIFSILIVVSLAEISKRLNPILGGVFSGLPLGTGIAVYFISYEQGVDFFISGIPWGIAALSSSILFCFSYLLVGRMFSKKSKSASILLSSLAGFITFFISGYFLHTVKMSFLCAILIFLVFYIINIMILRKIYTGVEFKKKQKQNSFYEFLFRGIFVAIIIVGITSVVSTLGSKWAGILSSFPSTLFALILVLHFEENNNLYPSVIFGFSHSISTLAVFYISLNSFLPILGLNLGFTLTYICSIIYILLYNNFILKIKN